MRCVRCGPLGAIALLLFAFLALPTPAHADCWHVDARGRAVDPPASLPGTANFGAIALNPAYNGYPEIGASFGIQATAYAGNTPQLACTGSTRAGLAGGQGSPLDPQGTLFPTGIPGVAFRIAAGQDNLKAYPDSVFENLSAMGPYTVDLIYTGVHPPFLQSSISELTTLMVDICSKPKINADGSYAGCGVAPVMSPVLHFSLSSLSIFSTGCMVEAGDRDIAVQLETLASTSLSGPVGTTAGIQPFTLLLSSCGQGTKVVVTLNTHTPVNGSQGVIANHDGSAQGVGVQLLQPDGGTPVTFGEALPLGTVDTGAGTNYEATLYARYYKTRASVSGGTVKATATYTLTYQ